MPPQSTRELLKSTSGIAVVFAAPEGEETETILLVATGVVSINVNRVNR